MIPNAFIQAWRSSAPWADARQVEQDLIICRALCDLFKAPALKGKIAFRGGTAINKLLFKEPLRYSEDIDLVQTQPEPIGTTVDAIRDTLSWLGKCRRDQAREHQCPLGVRSYPFTVENDWYAGRADIVSFAPEELFGTKLRALLQRNKGRDLFDLHHGLEQLSLDRDALIACFRHYLALEGKPISRAMAEQRMLEKLTRSLTEDIGPLLPTGIRFDDAVALRAFERIWSDLISRIEGDPWKLTGKALDELRARHPGLLQC